MLESVREVMKELADMWREEAAAQDPVVDPNIEVNTRDMPEMLIVKIKQKSALPSSGMKGAPPEKAVQFTVNAPVEEDTCLVHRRRCRTRFPFQRHQGPEVTRAVH